MDKAVTRSDIALCRLPLRVRFAHFEPAYGLLGRLAVRHGYSTSRRFVSEMSFGIRSFVHDVENGRRLAELALLTGIPEPAFRASTRFVDESGAMFIGRELLNARVDNKVLSTVGRVCPDCLRADLEEREGPIGCRPHRRVWWDLRAVTTCPIHGVLLIDTCPACGGQLSRELAAPRYCRCGFDLSGQVPDTLDPLDLTADRYLVGRLGGVERSTHALLDRMPLHVAATAMIRIGRVALVGARGLSKKGDTIEPVMQARMASLGHRMSASSAETDLYRSLAR
jgi:hypothetical protein